MDNVYIVTREDTTDRSNQIMGVFPAEGLAEIARGSLEYDLSEQEQDQGIFFRITAYELGKVYLPLPIPMI